MKTIYILKIERSSIDESLNEKFEFTNLVKAKKEAQKFKDQNCLIYKKDSGRCWMCKRFANDRNWHFQE
jgi:hypothetical protein